MGGDTMDIYSGPGTEIIFAFPENGMDYDQQIALQHLTIGGQYAVARTEVSRSSTKVWLEGYPGIAFNSVLFCDKLQRKLDDR